MRVGLTGGIGAGKSSVSLLLARHGAVIIDADQLAREVVGLGTTGLRRLVEEFGPQVLAPDGTLDRPAMGRRVFADPVARSALEAIVHPLVRARAAEVEAAASPGAVVVHDIALLFETGQAGSFEALIVVDAPPDLQRQRLTELRAMTSDDAEARIRAQASREERVAAADYVIVNDGSLDDLASRVRSVWDALTKS